VFSSRTPADLTPNLLAGAILAAKAAGRPILDLTESNPTRAGFAYPDDMLRRLADPRALVYAPSPFGSMDARAAVAREYDRRGMEVAPARIALTASTSEAYGFLFKLLTEAGDDVLVPRPSYPLFDHLARLELVTTRPYDLDGDAAWRIDFDSIEAALTPRTRAVLVVSPNNPTGSFVTTGEMRRLAQLCASRSMALIADEVFADFELVAGGAADAGHVLAQDDVLAFSLGGLSKSIGLPQAKLAWVAVGGPSPQVDAALARLEFICDTYLSVSTPVQLAAADLLDRGAVVRDQIACRVSANYQYLRAQAARVPACRCLASEGGWQAVLQVPSFQSEEALVVDLLENSRVLAHPGYFFDFPRESYLIVSLLPEEAAFADGIGRIVRHFEGMGGGHDWP
jgi:aspartate/methionine/tyrosine aminotransferase